MGIANTQYEGYCKKDIKTTAFKTSFGEVSVFKSGQKIPFEYTQEKYCFSNGISADVHYVEIDTRDYLINDEFEIRIGNISGFQYYDSDEDSVMLEFHNNKFCIAVIGFDSYYCFETDRFYGGYDYTFGSFGTDYGMKYKIVRDPKRCEYAYEYLIYTRIVCLPISDKYDAADLIDYELV